MSDFSPSPGDLRPLANGSIEEWDGEQWVTVKGPNVRSRVPKLTGQEGVGGRPPKGNPPAC